MSLVSDCNLMSQAPTQSSAGRSHEFALITLGWVTTLDLSAHVVEVLSSKVTTQPNSSPAFPRQ